MKIFKFSKKIIVTVLAIAVAFGFSGSSIALAATSPTLVGSAIFSVLGGAAVTNTGTTTMNGAIGVSPLTSISGGTINASATHSNDAFAIAAQADLTTAVTGLWTTLDQTCDYTYVVPTDLATLSPLAPGVYCSTTSFSLTNASSGSDLILTGAGPWIFKTGTTLITSPGSSVTVATGSTCNVWWRVGSAATLETTTAFVGNIVTANVAGTTALKTGATLNGRVLAQAAQTVTLDSNTITAPSCSTQGTLHVTKTVINTGGGTKVPSDFTMLIDAFNQTQDTSFLGGVGISTTLDFGAYSVTETGPAGYTSSSVGCSGTITDGDISDCTITNTYIIPSSGGGGGGITYGCKDINATNYNAFSSSKPELCIYEPTINIISTPFVPKLPKTGFPPETWYEFLLNNFLNLFR